MTTQSVPTRSELIGALRRSGDEFVARVSALPPDALEQGRYESGWNAREILAHVASIEWTYPRLLDLARGAPPPSAPAAAAPASAPTTPAAPVGVARAPGSSPPNNYNQRQVDKRAGTTVAELIDEFRRNRAATIAAVESADDALLATPVTSAGGAQGPLASVIQFVAVAHVAAHLNDIVGARA